MSATAAFICGGLFGVFIGAGIFTLAWAIVQDSMKQWEPKPRPAHPETYRCEECETGPWHITTATMICPNCSGAD